MLFTRTYEKKKDDITKKERKKQDYIPFCLRICTRTILIPGSQNGVTKKKEVKVS